MLKLPLQAASLGEVCGDPGLPSCHDPTLSLTGAVQQNAEQYIWHHLDCTSSREDGKADFRPPSGLHSVLLGLTVSCLQRLMKVIYQVLFVHCRHWNSKCRDISTRRWAMHTACQGGKVPNRHVVEIGGCARELSVQ